MTIFRNAAANERIVLILGNTDQSEMQPLVHWLSQLVSQSSRLVNCRHLDSLLSPEPPAEEKIYKFSDPRLRISEALEVGEYPELLIVLQSWPDEYSATDVSRLLEYAPLARIVVCYGNWCESLGRNRDVWPISVRVPVWAAQSRIQREWRLIQNPNSPNPPPWSASREEVFAFDHCLQESWFESENVAIDSPDPSYHQHLVEMMNAAGVQVGRSNAPILLFDADPWGPRRVALLQQYVEESPQTFIVALIDQIHSSVMSQILGFGASLVVQKLGFHRQLPARCTMATTGEIR